MAKPSPWAAPCHVQHYSVDLHFLNAACELSQADLVPLGLDMGRESWCLPLGQHTKVQAAQILALMLELGAFLGWDGDRLQLVD